VEQNNPIDPDDMSPRQLAEYLVSHAIPGAPNMVRLAQAYLDISPTGKPATIVGKPCHYNAYVWTIRADDGERYYLHGIGAPTHGDVGDRGEVFYQSTGARGLWYWRATLA